MALELFGRKSYSKAFTIESVKKKYGLMRFVLLVPFVLNYLCFWWRCYKFQNIIYIQKYFILFQRFNLLTIWIWLYTWNLCTFEGNEPMIYVIYTTFPYFSTETVVDQEVLTCGGKVVDSVLNISSSGLHFNIFLVH